MLLYVLMFYSRWSKWWWQRQQCVSPSHLPLIIHKLRFPKESMAHTYTRASCDTVNVTITDDRIQWLLKRYTESNDTPSYMHLGSKIIITSEYCVFHSVQGQQIVWPLLSNSACIPMNVECEMGKRMTRCVCVYWESIGVRKDEMGLDAGQWGRVSLYLLVW